MIAALLTASWLGLLTAISPCPLATNVAAVSYLGHHATRPARSLWGGLAYVLGRMLCYTVLAAALASGLLAAATASETFGRVVGLLVGPVLLVAGAMLLGLLPAPSFGSAGGLSRLLVPAVYGAATGLPALVFACLIAAGAHGVGKTFDKLKAVERWLRLLTGLLLMAIGAYLCVRTNLGA